MEKYLMVSVGAEYGGLGNLVSAWLIQVLSLLPIELELGLVLQTLGRVE